MGNTLYPLLSIWSGSTNEYRKTSRQGRKFVDWDVKHQHKQTHNKRLLIGSSN